MDETCATGIGGRSPHNSIAPIADHTNMFKIASADIPDPSGVEASTFCAANKNTRYQC